MKMTGSKILMECLLEQGVDTVFGYPGGTILNVYDELYRYSDRIHHILTAHEQGASHSADGYARSTGRPGVCFATSGPGATNLTTGIATAYMDSSPVVFITCNVTENLLGRDAFQEVDITGISMPITKCNYLVSSVDKLADIVREAFYLAASGRPGPVLIDIPKNITAELAEFMPLPKEKHVKYGHLAQLHSRTSHGFKATAPVQGDVSAIADMIKQAKKPMVLLGGGVVRAGAEKEAVSLAETIDAVTASTMMGLGAMPCNHSLFTGLIGMHGTKASNLAATRCDLLIVVGCRFSDRVALNTETFAKDAKIIQIDIDRAEINKNVLTDLHAVGDAKEVLQMLLPMLESAKHPDWIAEIAALKQPVARESAIPFQPHEVMQAIERATGGDVIIATDVGQNQLWAAQYFNYTRPGQLITSGGFGTMGFGLGAAMGASLGNPGKTVVHTTGDGCFRMNCHELATVEHYDIPVISVLFNNGTLGMVRQWQTLMYDGRYSATTLDRGPDFVKLAEAYGIKGYRVTNVSEFEAAFTEALDSGKAAVIECMMEMDEKVRPMVPGGASLTEFILE